MKTTKIYPFKLSIYIFITLLFTAILALFILKKFINISELPIILILLIILCLLICIYELSIIFRLTKAKNGEIIDAKYISVKRKYIFFETLEFEVDGNKISTSPLLFIRGYEIIYRKDISKIGLIKYKNKYYVFYKN